MLKTTYTGFQDRVRTTVDLPVAMRDRIQAAVQRGAVKSQNALIVQAIEQFLEMLERIWLDTQFAAMAEDEGYRTLLLKIAEEFAPLDRETWRASEANHAAR